MRDSKSHVPKESEIHVLYASYIDGSWKWLEVLYVIEMHDSNNHV